MGPTIHQWYTADEAVALFKGRGRRFCDGEFIVLPKDILCLATLGNEEEGSHIAGPSHFVWRPRRLDYAPADDFPWLPREVREVWDRSRKRIRKIQDHHVFLRTLDDDRFFYAGPAHLGSYGSSRNGGNVQASAVFSLNVKLPREAWLRFGGYPGWLVEVNHESSCIAAGDLPAFAKLIERLREQEFSHLYLTRYEEDSLTVFTNTRRGWLMYHQDPDDGGVYVRDPEYGDVPQAMEQFVCVCGINLELPAIQTLPREMAMRIAVEFFESGRLPGWVQWDPLV